MGSSIEFVEEELSSTAMDVGLRFNCSRCCFHIKKYTSSVFSFSSVNPISQKRQRSIDGDEDDLGKEKRMKKSSRISQRRVRRRLKMSLVDWFEDCSEMKNKDLPRFFQHEVRKRSRSLSLEDDGIERQNKKLKRVAAQKRSFIRISHISSFLRSPFSKVGDTQNPSSLGEKRARMSDWELLDLFGCRKKLKRTIQRKICSRARYVFYDSEIMEMELDLLSCVGPMKLGCVEGKIEDGQPLNHNKFQDDDIGRVNWEKVNLEDSVEFDSVPTSQSPKINISFVRPFADMILSVSWNLTRKPNLGFLANLNPLLQLCDGLPSRKYCLASIEKDASPDWSSVYLVILMSFMFVCGFIIPNKDKGLEGVHVQGHYIVYRIDDFRILPILPFSSNQALVLASAVSHHMKDRRQGTNVFRKLMQLWALWRNHHREDMLWLGVVSCVLYLWFSCPCILVNHRIILVSTVVCLDEADRCTAWSWSSTWILGINPFMLMETVCCILFFINRLVFMHYVLVCLVFVDGFKIGEVVSYVMFEYNYVLIFFQ